MLKERSLGDIEKYAQEATPPPPPTLPIYIGPPNPYHLKIIDL